VPEVLDESLDKACPEGFFAKESPRSAAGVGLGGSIGVEEDAGVLEVLDEWLDKAFPEELLATESPTGALCAELGDFGAEGSLANETLESPRGIAGVDVGDLEDEELLANETLEVPLTVPLPPPLPGTHPGTRFPRWAAAGPSVTATQPGRFCNRVPGPITSWGNGFVAEHALASSPEMMRPSFANTGQASIWPVRDVHVATARESTLLSQPFMKSACSP
jgi:hypothetical protein